MLTGVRWGLRYSCRRAGLIDGRAHNSRERVVHQLPVQEFLHQLCVALPDEFLLVIEREKPPLTAQGRYLRGTIQLDEALL
jgi:hypothetical protein